LHEATPPRDVRQSGCEDWTYDEIPF
jgi:hypothetical protein